ncbi:MAG: hypothetical protein LBC76_05000 [Treponema sp.]|jgi:hypothetical protein|nr:hypothetical protein [Treponema sp.]
MKSHIRCLFFTLLAAAAVFGCKTDPPPAPEQPPMEAALTPAILERLKKMPGYDLKNYHFILSGSIVLNSVSTRANDRGYYSDKNVKEGGVIFENVHEKSNITFMTKIIGEAVNLQESGDDILLRIYFEEKKDEANYPAATYFLVFSAKKSDMNAYFQLNYTPGPDTSLLSDEKGTLVYGADTYNVLFNGGCPYLLLKFEQRTSVIDKNRIIRGRLANTK